MSSNKKRPDEILLEGAETFRERNNVYGDNFTWFGSVMLAMFPNGIELKTIDDWNRMGTFVMCVAKMTRYASAFKSGGHVDSAHDLMVYGAMLEYLTRRNL